MASMKINYVDFEKVVFGLESIFRYFTMGQRRIVVAEYDPDQRMIHMSFCTPDENGVPKEETWGDIHRASCERLFLFTGGRFPEGFKIGERQRIIVDYDPQNKKASIECFKVVPEYGSAVVSESVRQ